MIRTSHGTNSPRCARAVPRAVDPDGAAPVSGTDRGANREPRMTIWIAIARLILGQLGCFLPIRSTNTDSISWARRLSCRIRQ
jgi:hypothetical protein